MTIGKIDTRQALTLTRFALKGEWRTAGLRAMGRKRKNTQLWVFWNMLSYLVLGAILSRFYRGNVEGEAFLLANAVVLLYVGIVGASNIFLSFGSGFLSPNETQIVSPLPVTSETFFFSRLVVLLVYTSVISGVIAVGPSIGVFLLRGHDPLPAITLLLTAIVAGIASGLAVIAAYGLILRRISPEKLSRTLGYAQFAGSLVTSGSIVILANFDRVIGLGTYTIADHPWLIAIPSVWFAAAVSLVSTPLDAPLLGLTVAALAFLALVSAAAHVLLAKNYETAVSDISGPSTNAAAARRLKREPFLFTWFSKLLGTHEARAVLMLFRAQFRYDARFRMSLFSILPLTLIYLIVAIVSGGVADPFSSGLKQMLNAQLLYMIALLMPLMLLQSVSQSDSYKSSWVFFISPLDRAKLLLAVRNTLLAWVVVPYLMILCAMFCFFMPPLHAIMHVAVLGALAAMIFQLFLMVAPKMPFAQQRRPNRNSFSTVFGIMSLSAGSVFMLALVIRFGYRSLPRFGITFALIVTLSLLLEQGLRARLRSRLAEEEFEA